MTTSEKRLDELFYELVPTIGKADSLAGELVRAICRIGYRYFNDGDHIGVGYGKETCNPSARFLRKHASILGDTGITSDIDALWGARDEAFYQNKLSQLEEKVVSLIDTHPELRELETEDMFSCTIPTEDRDDYEEE